jgi:hypothetical protein
MRLVPAVPARFSRPLIAALSTALVMLVAGPSAASVEHASGGARGTVSVIVRELPGSGAGPERLVQQLGGKVGRHIGIINGFAADVPRPGLARLEADRRVHSVTVNRRVRLLNDLDGWDQKTDLGSLHYVAQEVTGAGDYWNDRFTGEGVDVALIDSGVVPVDGLSTPGKIVHGPDLSFESGAENLRYLDTYGTHMAGIIAGRDDAVAAVVQKGEENFVGMAPDARIVSIKVANAHGATDVSQVLAAIDWVVQHRRDNGLNIRVLNLSFGTDGVQDYRVDPLAYAVEVAWRHGIVVVVAAGNGGFGSQKLNNPAYDPFVIAVGGADGVGTYSFIDDTVQPWSSSGDGTRNPDLVAPGKSIASLRVPGSSLDLAHPGARVGATPRFFRGSGTSQAAAVVSGAAALVIQQRPDITPDQLKRLLKMTASRLLHADEQAQGEGMLNLKRARAVTTPPSSTSAQLAEPSTGTGSLDLARGSSYLTEGGVDLRGEQDIFGAPFDSQSWAAASLAGNAWSGGTWNGNAWSGNAWSGNAWSGNAWSGNAWSGNAWSGNAWSGNAWSGNAWSGNAWSGNAWSGNAWSGNAWSGNAWSSSAWGAGGGSSDSTAPNVELTAPVNGVYVRGNVALSADASDNVAVSRVYFLVDGSVVASDNTAPYSVSWDSTLVTDGLVTITARAVDVSGNDVESAERLVTVDNTAPETTINSGPTGSVGSSTATFTFSALEGGATFECSLDDGAWVACTSPAYYSGLANGLHSFRVRAVDSAGNADSSVESRSWTVTVVNLLSNGDFESSLSGWKGSNASLTLVTGGAVGGKAARVARSTGTTFGIVSSPRPVASTTRGVTYRAHASVTSDRPGKTTCLRVREYRSGSLVGSAQICLAAANTWQEFPLVSYAAKNNGSQLEVDVYQGGAVSGDSFQVDGLGLTRSAPPALRS